ncbi:hypothetical protein VCHA37P192_110162 [Vibrio chagasii]|nr:hypothetical protein VCHA37P192_110162 [Vibrio chagasii]
MKQTTSEIMTNIIFGQKSVQRLHSTKPTNTFTINSNRRSFSKLSGQDYEAP